MPTIARNGTTLYYESTGNGRPILFSHGYGGTAEMWARQAEELSKQYRVITWEMRGHARSDSPSDLAAYSEAEAVADMEAILDACDAPHAVIAGLALGGYLSLCFYIARPERTDALILVGTDALADSLDAKGLDALDVIAWGRHPLHRSATGLAQASRGMLKQSDAHVMEALPTIDVPTLVVVGELDTEFLIPSSYMTKKIPDATEVVVAGVGHGANMDAPDDFNRSVLDFLAKLPAQGDSEESKQ